MTPAMLLENLLLDLRQGLRALRRRPGFTAAAVLTLALGIGANGALFSLVNGILLQPLPYPAPERLVRLWESNASESNHSVSPSRDTIREWRARSHSFEDIAGYFHMGRTLRVGDDSEVVRVAQVSVGFFPVLDVPPLLGRTFTPEETARAVYSGAAAPLGEDPVAVLSHGLWQRRFGGDPAVIGATLTLERRTWTVVGVMPPGFHMPDPGIDLWIPWSFQGKRGGDQRYLTTVARLRPGVSLEAAQQEMDAVAVAMAGDRPETWAGWGARVVPLQEEQVRSARTPLLILLGAVGLVLLVACANLASLQLAGALERGREMAVRLALGASRLRLVRQLLAESVLLALAGGALGVGLALWGLDLLQRLQPAGIPRLQEVTLDLDVLGFILAVALLAGLLFGLAPAMAGARVDLVSAMKVEGNRTATAGPTRQRLRGALVVAEIALAVVLVAGAGLMGRSFARLTAVDPGFDPEGVLVLPIFLSQSEYDRGAKTRAYYAQIEDGLRALPGVLSVGGATALPMSPLGPDFDVPVWPEGAAPPPPGTQEADIRMALTGHFRTLGMSIVRGRGIIPEDTPDSRPVVVINETLARRHWAGGNPIGRRLMVNYGKAGLLTYEIVGVVRDVRFHGLRERPRPEVYIPHAQRPYLVMNLAVKTAGDPRALIPAVRRAVLDVDPDQPAHSVVPLIDLLGDTLERDRFAMLLLAGFAATAALLAAFGIFGLMSYLVGRRSFEIGVRMALGAEPRDILGLVFLRGAVLTLLGALLGTLVALGTTRLLGSLLYEVGPADPVAFAGAVALLSLMALAACWGPARRAARVDVVEALRAD